MHILSIDDDQEDREIFKEAIIAIDSSYTCHLANDGLQGLKLLEEAIVMGACKVLVKASTFVGICDTLSFLNKKPSSVLAFKST